MLKKYALVNMHCIVLYNGAKTKIHTLSHIGGCFLDYDSILDNEVSVSTISLEEVTHFIVCRIHMKI